MYKELRVWTWAQLTLEAQKFCGCLTGLQQTAAFISDTGLNILHSRIRRTQAKNPINTRSLGLIDPTFTKASKDIALNYPTHHFHNAKGQVPFSVFFLSAYYLIVSNIGPFHLKQPLEPHMQMCKALHRHMRKPVDLLMWF